MRFLPLFAAAVLAGAASPLPPGPAAQVCVSADQMNDLLRTVDVLMEANRQLVQTQQIKAQVSGIIAGGKQ